MKLKYYLRGLGIGIIITTIVLMIASSSHKTELTDAEIIQRAESLGMVMKEEPLFPNSETNNNTEGIEETEISEVVESETEQNTEETSTTVAETELKEETEGEEITETQTEAESEVTTEAQNTTEMGIQSETESEIEEESETESETSATTTRETYHLVIPSGSVPRLICNELEANGVIENAAELRQYLVDMGYATSIIVGEYEVPYGATYEEIYTILKAGPQ